MPAGAEREASFTYKTKAAGVLRARLLRGDAFPYEDGASVELPLLQTLPVTVYSNEPELLPRQQS